jgi:hypothetical protein
VTACCTSLGVRCMLLVARCVFHDVRCVLHVACGTSEQATSPPACCRLPSGDHWHLPLRDAVDNASHSQRGGQRVGPPRRPSQYAYRF